MKKNLSVYRNVNLLLLANVMSLAFVMSFVLTGNVFAQFSKIPDTALTVTSKLLISSAEVRIANTSDGKIFIAWQQIEDVNGRNTATVRLQLLDKDGNNLWEQGGILVSNKPTNDVVFKNDLNLLLTSKNEAVVAVADFRTHNTARDIVLYKIDTSKGFVWGNDGVTAYSNETNSAISAPSVAINDRNEVIVAVQTLNTTRINVINENGTKKLENDILVDGAKDLIVVKAPNGCFYAVYKMNNSLYADYYNPALTDEIKFLFKGRYVGRESGADLPENEEYWAVSDNEGGIFIIWKKSKLYIQRIDSEGIRLFEAEGISLSPTAENITNPIFSIDTTHKVVNIAWYNLFASYSLLFQKVAFDGEVLLNEGGVNSVTDAGMRPAAMTTADNGQCLLITSKTNAATGGDELYLVNLLLEGENLFDAPKPVYIGSINIADPIISTQTSIVSTNYRNQMVIAWYDEYLDATAIASKHSVKAQNVAWNGTLGPGASEVNIKESKFRGEDIAVYPNPVATNLFNIKYNSKNEQNISINIYNVQGKLCHSFDFELVHGENNILVNYSFDKGMYIVKLKLKNEDIYTNFIVE